MCGACGVQHDWAGPLVAGSANRRDVARCLDALVTSVAVRPLTQGWVVKKPTGAARPVQTLDGLIKAIAPHARHHDWAELERALLEIPTPRQPRAEQVDWPKRTIQNQEGASPVLSRVTHLPAHMKLAAFALGVQSCDTSTRVFTALDDSHSLGGHEGVVTG